MGPRLVALGESASRMLAQLPPDAAREIVLRAGMPAQTERSITEPDALEEELERVREMGYALDDATSESIQRVIGQLRAAARRLVPAAHLSRGDTNSEPPREF